MNDRQLVSWGLKPREVSKEEVKKIGYGHFRVDIDSGIYPILSLECKRRVKNKESCVICVVGEAGIGKSMMGIQIARNIDKRFGIDQIVFTHSE